MKLETTALAPRIASIFICILIHLQPLDAQGIYTHGQLEMHRYPTSIKGPVSKKLYVYLPADYHRNDKAYPVVYFLHGAKGNERSWIEKGKILEIIDSLTLCREITECIYVFPNTNKYHHDYDYISLNPKGSIESFMNLNGSAEYSFINDVMTYVDNNFRTLPSMKYRAIAGLSLGGLQALYISANSISSFGYIGLFSPIIYPPLNTGKYSAIYKDIENKLVRQSALSPSLYLVMIGEDDPFYRSAYLYSELLRSLNIRHNFIRTPGAHTWENWSDYSIIFLKSLWKENLHTSATKVDCRVSSMD